MCVKNKIKLMLVPHAKVRKNVAAKLLINNFIIFFPLRKIKRRGKQQDVQTGRDKKNKKQQQQLQ